MSRRTRNNILPWLIQLENQQSTISTATVQLQLAVFRTVLCFDKHILLFHLLERIVSLCHLHSVIKDSDHAQKTVAHNPPGSNSSHWMDHSHMIYSFHVYASQNQPWIKLYPRFKIIAKYFKKWTTWNRDTPQKRAWILTQCSMHLRAWLHLFGLKKQLQIAISIGFETT